MNRRTFGLIALFSVLGTATGHAGFKNRDSGTTTANFLQIAPDARGAALGEAVSALAEDATSGYWNPAGLARIDGHHASFSHGSLYEGVFYDSLAYAMPVRTILGREKKTRRPIRSTQSGAVGITILFLSAGRLTEVDNTGTKTGGDFSPQDYTIITSWGMSLTRNLDLGLSVKYISSRINQTATTGAIDLGARWKGRLGPTPFTAAASVHNMGGGLEYIQQTDPLPLLFRAGASFHPLKSWAVTAEITAPKGNRVYPAAGMEYLITMKDISSVALRMGYNGRINKADVGGTTSISVGAGVGFKRFTIDYAWVPFGLLGNAHRFSLSTRF